MLPAIILATFVIYFLGFYDFGIEHISDNFYSSPDVSFENVTEISFSP
jgi:hypothetical protein